MDSTVKKVLDGINLILKYEPEAQLASGHDIIYFGSYEIRSKMTPEEQMLMDEWGWTEEYESWAKNI